MEGKSFLDYTGWTEIYDIQLLQIIGQISWG